MLYSFEFALLGGQLKFESSLRARGDLRPVNHEQDGCSGPKINPHNFLPSGNNFDRPSLLMPLFLRHLQELLQDFSESPSRLRYGGTEKIRISEKDHPGIVVVSKHIINNIWLELVEVTAEHGLRSCFDQTVPAKLLERKKLLRTGILDGAKVQVLPLQRFQERIEENFAEDIHFLPREKLSSVHVFR
jgi:hypothetical protein